MVNLNDKKCVKFGAGLNKRARADRVLTVSEHSAISIHHDGTAYVWDVRSSVKPTVEYNLSDMMMNCVLLPEIIPPSERCSGTFYNPSINVPSASIQRFNKSDPAHRILRDACMLNDVR